MNQTKNAQQRKPPYNRRWRSTDLHGTHLELELDCGAAGPGAWPSPSYARAPGGIPKAPSGSEGGVGARAEDGWEEWRREWWEGWELGRRGGGAEEERKAVVAAVVRVGSGRRQSQPPHRAGVRVADAPLPVSFSVDVEDNGTGDALAVAHHVGQE